MLSPDMLSPNKRLVWDFFQNVFNAHDAAAARAYMHPDYRQHSTDVDQGPEAFVAHFTQVFQRFPHFHVEILQLIEEGDRVVMHGYGVTDPGRIEVIVVDIYRIQDGRLAEHWESIMNLDPKDFGTEAFQP